MDKSRLPNKTRLLRNLKARLHHKLKSLRKVKVGYPTSQGCSTILRLDYPTRLRLAHRVLACGRFHPESLSQRGLIVTPGTLYRLTWKEGITPLTDHRGRCFRVLMWCQFVGCWFRTDISQHSHFWFRTLQATIYFLRRSQANAITHCILVIVSWLLNISLVVWWNMTV